MGELCETVVSILFLRLNHTARDKLIIHICIIHYTRLYRLLGSVLKSV